MQLAWQKHLKKKEESYFPRKSLELGDCSKATLINCKTYTWKGGTMCVQQKNNLEDLL